MEGFKIEVILNSLKDLQDEKQQKEIILSQECTRRKQLEAKLEAAVAKHTTVSAKHAKIQEKECLAEQKVTQLLAQVKHYENITLEKRQIIEELNNNIQSQQRSQQEQITNFEEKMSELADRFRNSVHVYTEESLTLDIKDYKEKVKDLSNGVDSKQQNIQKLTDDVKKLQDKDRDDDMDIDEHTREMVLNMFHSEKKAVHEMKNSTEEKLKNLQSEYDSLLSRLEDLKHQVQEITEPNRHE